MDDRQIRWLIPISALLTLIGYFGPWVNHAAAGLVITGLDLGEYVKFLPPPSNPITVWREGFYLPLVAVSLACSLNAYQGRFNYPWVIRTGMLAVAIIAALNLLPPAWTPARLAEPEFRLQVAGIGFCLLAVAFSPFLALLPRLVVIATVVGVNAVAIWRPIHDFLGVLPDISTLYNRSLHPGWGMYLMGGSLLLLLLATVAAHRHDT